MFRYGKSLGQVEAHATDLKDVGYKLLQVKVSLYLGSSLLILYGEKWEEDGMSRGDRTQR